MKKNLLIATIALFSLTCWSQNLQKPTTSEISSLPTWAQLMYSENPSIYEIDNLFREFYSKNTFKNENKLLSYNKL